MRIHGLFLGIVMGILVLSSSMLRAGETDLSGTYDIQGWEPTGDTCSTPDYTGTAEIFRKGNVYLYRGTAENIAYQGVGFAESDHVLRFAYRGADGDAGEIRGENQNGIWVCQWISVNTPDGKPGREIWKKRKADEASDPGNAVIPASAEE